jgi:type IV pilus assembly protein PilP
MKHKKSNHPIIIALIILVCGSLMQIPGAAYSDNTVQAETTPSYFYNAEGKTDPFEPFINVQKEEKEKKEGKAGAASASFTKAKNLQFLSPLERYDIGTFRLVAIGGSNGKRVAIVEDSKGKSFSLYRNSKIGMNEGRVINILDDQVIIMEEVMDATGKITPGRVILKLMKDDIEGDR